MMTSEEFSPAAEGSGSHSGAFKKVVFAALLLFGAGGYVLFEKGLYQQVVFDLKSSPAKRRALREAFELRDVLASYPDHRDLARVLEEAAGVVPVSRIVGLKVFKVVERDEATGDAVRSEALFSFSRIRSGSGGRLRYDADNLVGSGTVVRAEREVPLLTRAALAPEDIEKIRGGAFGSVVSEGAPRNALVTMQEQLRLEPTDRGGASLTLESADGDFEFEVCLLLAEEPSR